MITQYDSGIYIIAVIVIILVAILYIPIFKRRGRNIKLALTAVACCFFLGNVLKYAFTSRVLECRKGGATYEFMVWGFSDYHASDGQVVLLTRTWRKTIIINASDDDLIVTTLKAGLTSEDEDTEIPAHTSLLSNRSPSYYPESPPDFNQKVKYGSTLYWLKYKYK